MHATGFPVIDDMTPPERVHRVKCEILGEKTTFVLMSILMCQFCGDQHSVFEPCDEAFEAGMDACYGCGELHSVSELAACPVCGSGYCDKAECQGICECSVYSVAEQLVRSANG